MKLREEYETTISIDGDGVRITQGTHPGEMYNILIGEPERIRTIAHELLRLADLLDEERTLDDFIEQEKSRSA